MAYDVLLVDDQPGFLEMARGMLEPDPTLRVVGTVTNGEEALGRLAELRPDALVIDVYLPGMNGFETARQAVALVPGLRVVMISVLDDPEFEEAAHAVGALGFLSKRSFSASTLRALLLTA